MTRWRVAAHRFISMYTSPHCSSMHVIMEKLFVSMFTQVASEACNVTCVLSGR